MAQPKEYRAMFQQGKDDGRRETSLTILLDAAWRHVWPVQALGLAGNMPQCSMTATSCEPCMLPSDAAERCTPMIDSTGYVCLVSRSRHAPWGSHNSRRQPGRAYMRRHQQDLASFFGTIENEAGSVASAVKFLAKEHDIHSAHV